MKRIIATILSVVMLLSMIPVIAVAEGFDATAEITAITDGSTLRCIVEITNQAENDTFFIFIWGGLI